MKTNGDNELVALRRAAQALGCKVHPRSGINKIKQQIIDKKQKDALARQASGEEAIPVKLTEAEARAVRRDTAIKRGMAQVRFRLTNMNPSTRNLQGTTVTAGNSSMGSVTEYIPFETPWHSARIVFNYLKEKELQINKSKNVNGINVPRNYIVKEFAIELLDDLSFKELNDLAAQQAAAKAT